MAEMRGGSLRERLLLTRREAEVVECIFDGQGQEQIAASLGISVETVKKIKSNVFKKAGVSSAIRLVGMAWRNGGFLYWEARSSDPTEAGRREKRAGGVLWLPSFGGGG